MVKIEISVEGKSAQEAREQFTETVRPMGFYPNDYRNQYHTLVDALRRAGIDHRVLLERHQANIAEAALNGPMPVFDMETGKFVG